MSVVVRDGVEKSQRRQRGREGEGDLCFQYIKGNRTTNNPFSLHLLSEMHTLATQLIRRRSINQGISIYNSPEHMDTMQKNKIGGKLKPFSSLTATSFLVFVILFLLATIRHNLLHSNAYDLGIFEQYLWMASKGIFAPGTIHEMHIFADHGAFALLPMSLLYSIWSSPLCLLAMQSFSIAFTAIPLWIYTKKFDATDNQSWLVALTWWMAPAAFNTNLFDFHPEICFLPFIAYLFCKVKNREHPLSILFLLICILFARDGNALLLTGIAITLFLYRMPKTSLALASCTVLWILFLTRFLYPALGKTGSSFHAADRYTHLGDSWSGFLHNLFTDPASMLNSMQPADSIIYVLIVFAPFALLLRKSDPAIILSTAPLLASNILSSNYSQKTLIHHYSLPIVLLLLIATITKGNLQDFYSKGKSRFHLLWISILWILLAKPGYFASTYLSRTEMIKPLNNAKELIQSTDRLITSSYLAPHFSGRGKRGFLNTHLGDL